MRSYYYNFFIMESSFVWNTRTVKGGRSWWEKNPHGRLVSMNGTYGYSNSYPFMLVKIQYWEGWDAESDKKKEGEIYSQGEQITKTFLITAHEYMHTLEMIAQITGKYNEEDWQQWWANFPNYADEMIEDAEESLQIWDVYIKESEKIDELLDYLFSRDRFACDPCPKK